jgi:hypothetical protein
MSGGAGLPQVIDLHWKISNRPVVADLLTFEELQAQSVPVPALGERARRLGDVHALILACVHMAAHHRNLEHLLWCYDLHLLACRLDADGFADLVTLARDREVAAICRINLERAVARFRTVVPPGTIARLETTGERSALLLDAAAWYGDVRLTDLRLLPTWRAKFQMIRDVALPSADYMLKEYDAPSRLLLPALHVYRLTRGTWRLLRRFAQA